MKKSKSLMSGVSYKGLKNMKHNKKENCFVCKRNLYFACASQQDIFQFKNSYSLFDMRNMVTRKKNF